MTGRESGPELPAFVREIDSTLAVHSQYVLHGNIRDVFLRRPSGQQPRLVPLRQLLWEVLEPSGYEFVLMFDQVDGLAWPRDHMRGIAQARGTDGVGKSASLDHAADVARMASYRKVFSSGGYSSE